MIEKTEYRVVSEVTGRAVAKPCAYCVEEPVEVCYICEEPFCSEHGWKNYIAGVPVCFPCAEKL
jgi:hypothetical protein